MAVDLIVARIREEKGRGEILGLFFDFDGTISEIVETPDKARILPGARKCLIEMVTSDDLVAGIISGREIDDLKQRVGVSGLIYSGNHGAELEFFGEKLTLSGRDQCNDLSCIAEKFEKLSANVPGILVENKGFSVTLHTRSVEVSLLEDVRSFVRETLGGFHNLTLREGKRVFEVFPLSSVDKGEVLELILDKIEGKFEMPVFPVYFGDDLTDKKVYDLFLRTKKGVSVFVKGKDPMRLEADFELDGPAEVVRFMDAILGIKNSGGTY